MNLVDYHSLQFHGGYGYMGEYKKPKSVDFWEELPKSSTGKLLKKDIRQVFKKK